MSKRGFVLTAELSKAMGKGFAVAVGFPQGTALSKGHLQCGLSLRIHGCGSRRYSSYFGLTLMELPTKEGLHLSELQLPAMGQAWARSRVEGATLVHEAIRTVERAAASHRCSGAREVYPESELVCLMEESRESVMNSL